MLGAVRGCRLRAGSSFTLILGQGRYDQPPPDLQEVIEAEAPARQPPLATTRPLARRVHTLILPVIRVGSKAELAVRAEANELESFAVGFAIDEHEIRPNVAAPETFHARRQGIVKRGGNDSSRGQHARSLHQGRVSQLEISVPDPLLSFETGPERVMRRSLLRHPRLAQAVGFPLELSRKRGSLCRIDGLRKWPSTPRSSWVAAGKQREVTLERFMGLRLMTGQSQAPR